MTTLLLAEPHIVTENKYYVRTWDMYLQKFTPQKGIRVGPYRLMALRRVLHRLRNMGYGGTRGDNSVLIERKDEYLR